MPKVMVAMSGGVDSSVAAALLSEQGYEVIGATLRLYERDGKATEAEKAKSVCDTLGIPHFLFDMRDVFREKVIKSFSAQYDAGLTPNPCIECNKYLKFGALLEKAIEMGCDYIATGHYSKIKFFEDADRYALIRPDDRKKDQTYVLWHLTQYQLSHILMPLGSFTKPQVREIAENYGFVSAHSAESQDICFVPDGDYAAFLQEYNGKKFAVGNYVDLQGNILGKHSGHQCYTVGQRKGLGIALGRPQFVISKNAQDNTVVLSDEKYLFKTRVFVKNVSMMARPDLTEPLSCTAKLRYSAADTPCTVCPTGEGTAVVEFESPVRAPSPGQSAVFYQGDTVLGGGIIERGE